jgi:hypothetical protein
MSRTDKGGCEAIGTCAIVAIVNATRRFGVRTDFGGRVSDRHARRR